MIIFIYIFFANPLAVDKKEKIKTNYFLPRFNVVTLKVLSRLQELLGAKII